MGLSIVDKGLWHHRVFNCVSKSSFLVLASLQRFSFPRLVVNLSGCSFSFWPAAPFGSSFVTDMQVREHPACLTFVTGERVSCASCV